MTLDLAAEPVPLYWAEDHQVIRLAGTRISLDLIVGLYQDGRTAEEIVSEDYYPHLDLADVHAAIAYYLRHKKDVDSYIEDRNQWADEQRAIMESSPDVRTTAARIVALSHARKARR